jgi:hypothetical protein
MAIADNSDSHCSPRVLAQSEPRPRGSGT